MKPREVKTSFVNNIPLAHGEITVVMGDHAEQVLQHSCKLAEQVYKAGVGVLLVNCGVSDRRFRAAAPDSNVLVYPTDEGLEIYIDGLLNKETINTKPHLVLHSSVRGNLVGETEDFHRLTLECGVKVIILSGWEWASSSYRRKERLLYFLREIMADLDIAVVIYSQSSTKPVAGYNDRGGIGKLGMLALHIVRLEMSKKIDEVAPKPPPLVGTENDLWEAEISAQLLASKINNLEDIKPPMQSEKAKRVKKEEKQKAKVQK